MSLSMVKRDSLKMQREGFWNRLVGIIAALLGRFTESLGKVVLVT
jgi:hypothetical protein